MGQKTTAARIRRRRVGITIIFSLVNLVRIFIRVILVKPLHHRLQPAPEGRWEKEGKGQCVDVTTSLSSLKGKSYEKCIGTEQL